ncbi:hypothetical protein MTO96_009726 [Rhipicephalus appendiculatus]
MPESASGLFQSRRREVDPFSRAAAASAHALVPQAHAVSRTRANRSGLERDRERLLLGRAHHAGSRGARLTSSMAQLRQWAPRDWSARAEILR